MTVKARVRRNAQIEKVEEVGDGTLNVFGCASTEERDSDGEMILASAMQDALAGYMKWGAVREMHQPKAAGVALSAEVNADTKRTMFSAHVVDPIACEKVRKNVYKAFSISGPVLARDPKDPTVITKIKWVETSLVDRPANEGATIDEVVIVKADGLIVIEKSLWAVSRLADLLDALDSLRLSAEWGDATEGAGWPEGLKAGIVALCDTLRTMVGEETNAVTTDTAEMMAKLANVEAELIAVKLDRDEKTHLVALDSAFLAALGVPEGADLATVQKMAADRGSPDAEKTDLAMKLQAANDTLAKVQGERDAAIAKGAQLEAQIAKDAADLDAATKELFAKGTLRAVPKTKDTGTLTPADDDKPDDSDPQVAAKMIRKVHASGGSQIGGRA